MDDSKPSYRKWLEIKHPWQKLVTLGSQDLIKVDKGTMKMNRLLFQWYCGRGVDSKICITWIKWMTYTEVLLHPGWQLTNRVAWGFPRNYLVTIHADWCVVTRIRLKNLRMMRCSVHTIGAIARNWGLSRIAFMQCPCQNDFIAINEMPSLQLTYPLLSNFGRWFSLSPGRICQFFGKPSSSQPRMETPSVKGISQ